MKLLKWSKKAAMTCKDDQLFLRLISDRNDDICLAIVGKDGKMIDSGYVIYFNEQLKTFVICDDLNKKAPLHTNMFGEASVITRRDLFVRQSLDKDDEKKLVSVKRLDLSKMPDSLRESLQKLLETIGKAKDK